MSVQVIVTLSDEAYARLERYTQMTGQAIDNFISDMLPLTVPDVPDIDPKSLESLSNEEIMAILETPMPEGDLLSELLDKQQAGRLTRDERVKLAELMNLYQFGLLKGSYALVEAVRRGLRKRLDE